MRPAVRTETLIVKLFYLPTIGLSPALAGPTTVVVGTGYVRSVRDARVWRVLRDLLDLIVRQFLV